MVWDSLRKQLTFGNATSGLAAKWRLRNECRNSILMTHYYPDVGSTSDWLNQISHVAWPIRNTTQIWVVTRHQYGISALVSQTLFSRETRGSIAKCWLFSQVGLGGQGETYELKRQQVCLHNYADWCSALRPLQSCALRKILWNQKLTTCEIQDVQHMISMPKVRFPSSPRAKVRCQRPPGATRAHL